MSDEPEIEPSGTPTEPETEPEKTPDNLLGKDPEEEKEAEGKAEEFVPLTVDDLEIPEGFEVDEGLSTKFLDTINDQSMESKDRANALINLQKEVLEAAQERDKQLWENTQEEWKEEALKDPEVGGEKLEPTLTKVAKLIDEYGSDELRGMLYVTGAGNSVHLVKFLSKMADQLVEPEPTPGVPGETRGEQTAAQRLYPSMKG